MEFRNEVFDAIVAGQVAEDSYDIALSQVTITEERAEVVDFSVPYFKSDQGLLVPAGTTVSTWDDVKAMNLGVQAATTAEFYFQEIPEWKLDSDPQSFPDLTSAYEALSSRPGRRRSHRHPDQPGPGLTVERRAGGGGAVHDR